jgi:hypothetical protein
MSNLNYSNIASFSSGGGGGGGNGQQDFNSSSDLNLHWSQSNVAGIHNRSLSPAM